MDEALILGILRKASFVISLFGIMVGLDLIFGAKVLLAAKRFLDRAYNFDKAVTEPRARRRLGIVMIFISLAMLLLLVTTK